MKPIQRAGTYRFLLPLAGILLFLLFYFLAAGIYTGGSWVNPEDAAFSFRYNYLCDLLDTLAVNGTPNAARHWARASLGVLCAGLAYLWYHLPALFPKKGWHIRLMRILGVLAFGVTLFLSAGTHDITLRIAGVLGALALVICIRELFRHQYRATGLLGLLCLALFLLNYAFYETNSFLSGLPLLQKGTFVSFLLWFVLLDLQIFLQKKRLHQKMRQDSLKHPIRTL